MLWDGKCFRRYRQSNAIEKKQVTAAIFALMTHKRNEIALISKNLRAARVGFHRDLINLRLITFSE